MIRKIFQTFIPSLFSLIGLFCAGQLPPAGGPIDVTPPEIISTYPAQSKLNFAENKLKLEFSKYVDRRSVEDAVFISPSLGDLTFNWSGTEVEINFSNPLKNNTTYVITVGTDVVDIRNHNRMARAFTLPFSTGEKIDTALVSGKIFASDPDGVMVFAYQLDGKDRDTINPVHTKPDYLTQTGKDGIFSLSHLAFGNYRLIAVKDEYRNLLYDPQTDKFGVLNSDISLSSKKPSIDGIQFLLTVEDTTKPFITSVRPLDRSHIYLRFSEPIDTFILKNNDIQIIDTLTKNKLPILDFSLTDQSNIEAQIVTPEIDSSKGYQIMIKSLYDLHGNKNDGDYTSILFTGTDSTDTTKPGIQYTNVIDSTNKILIGDSLIFIFSEAIRRSKFETGFSLTDSIGNKLTGNFVWWNSASVSFIPAKQLSWNNSYKIKIVLDSVEDYSGNHFIDSVLTFRFNTLDEKKFGKIEGEVTDKHSDESGKIYLKLTETAKKNLKIKQKSIDKPGLFKIDKILEGKYSLFAFRDIDNNGLYTYGNIFPFVRSERFFIYPDTLKVRARWPLEGVTIELK